MNGKGGGKLQRFFVELRALALAVLAVQVCAAESGLQVLQLSRIDRFVADPCKARALTATTLATAPASKHS